MASVTPSAPSVRERLDQLFKQRIVIFDGSIGVLLQKQGLTEEDWRGERFRDHPKLLKNNVDILNLSRPDVVSRIHREYLEAGADLITTNTFTATPVSQADYGLEDLTYEINVAGARLAREAAAAYENRFVAGSMGPTNVTLSLSPKVEDPSYRAVTFDQLRDGYAVAPRGLRWSPSPATRPPACPTHPAATARSRRSRAACCATSPRAASSTPRAAAAAPRPSTSARSARRSRAFRHDRSRNESSAPSSAGWSRSRSDPTLDSWSSGSGPTSPAR